MPRRVLQYLAGLVVMGLGVVLIKRAELGIAPITSIPASVSNILPRFTLGNTTIFLHVLCVIGQIILLRRVTLKSLLTLLVGIPFGYIIDGLMLLIDPGTPGLAARIVLLVLGLPISGLGVMLIVGADLMLPAPDGLTHVISQVYDKKLGNVKIVSDCVYIAISVALDLIFTGRIYAVGVGTVMSMLFVGRFVNWFARWFPGIVMAPFWKKKDPCNPKCC